MKIHRSDPPSNYFKYRNGTARFGDLSWAARGYLGDLLSRPDDWDETADAAWKRAQRERGEKGTAESRRDVQAIWAELKAARYIVSGRVPLGGGRWATEVHVYDQPQLSDLPGAGKSVPPAETGICAGGTDLPQAGQSARPAETETAPASDLPHAGKPDSGKSVPPAETGICAGGTDLPQAGQSSKRLKTKRSLSETLAGIVTGATDATPDEARETVALIRESQKPGNPVAYFRTLAKNGDLPIWLDKIRNGPGGPTSVADSVGTPSAPRLATLCAWCSRPGHDLAACPDRATLSRDPDSEARPAAKPVPSDERGEGREEFTRRLAAMRARPAERARVPAGVVYPDESRDVLPDDDGDHAA